jgi:hypothetical protein
MTWRASTCQTGSQVHLAACVFVPYQAMSLAHRILFPERRCPADSLVPSCVGVASPLLTPLGQLEVVDA